jgi:OPA family glycerol-3-phosphate transporter-like MFS transporter
MSYEISKRAKAMAWLMTLVYFASYLMRKNFSVMMANICTELGVADSALGIVASAMTITYGAGQIINGIIGDKIKPQLMLTVGLSLAAVCNVVMFFIPASIPAMAAVWAVNGYAHAMLWPPMVRLLTGNLNDEEYNYAVVRVFWGSSIATISMYLLCPLFLTFMSWRGIVILFALVGALIAAIWIGMSPRYISKAPLLSECKAEKTLSEPKKAGIPVPKYAYLPIGLIMIGIVMQGILRDGVTNWMPSLMNESFGLGEELSILSTVFLAIFSMISFTVASNLHTKILKNELTCSAVIYVFSAIAALLLYFANEYSKTPIFFILLLSLIVAGMHGVNMMLITIVPKRFANSGRVSTYSGVLNACTYVGSAVATYGVAALAENYSWGLTILVWTGAATLGAIVCAVIIPTWRKFKKEYAGVED